MTRRVSVDPAVADLLSGLTHKHEMQKKPLAERRRAAKERVKAARRNRVMLDLPDDVESQLVELSTQLECPISQAAAALLIISLRQGIDLTPYRLPSRSPRFTYVLDLAEIAKSIR